MYVFMILFWILEKCKQGDLSVEVLFFSLSKNFLAKVGEILGLISRFTYLKNFKVSVKDWLFGHIMVVKSA